MMDTEDYYLEDFGPRLWMPYQSYVRTAECFNDVDLITMLHELPQVLYYRVQADSTMVENGIRFHRPCVNQWATYERELIEFWKTIADEFLKRLSKAPARTFDPHLASKLPDFNQLSLLFNQCETPAWRFGFEEYYTSQKKILLLHDTNYYKNLWPHLYENSLFSKQFYPIWPSRIEAFWPNGHLPGKFTKANFATGVTPEDVIDCIFETTYGNALTQPLQAKES